MAVQMRENRVFNLQTFGGIADGDSICQWGIRRRREEAAAGGSASDRTNAVADK